MSQNQYAQLHRQLLFHWTKPLGSNKNSKNIFPAPKTSAERSAYVDHLGEILKTGLEFRTPPPHHAEHIVKGKIEAKLPMLCFSEWSVSGGLAQASRYGQLGLGFTRKYIMEMGGRQVVYLPNKPNDPFYRALVALLENAKTVKSLKDQVTLITSLLKTYNPSSEPKAKVEKEQKKGGVAKKTSTKNDDRHLGVDFGGLFKNLEDKEWRILQENHLNPKSVANRILCEPGSLAMIVLPDHKTLAHVMQNEMIRDSLFVENKPAVCFLTREMLYSI